MTSNAAISSLENFFARAPGWIDRGQATTVLTSVAVVEEILQAALLNRMRPLTKKEADRLFEGYGPISTLAAKIDVAYAFNLLSKAEYSALLIAKNIRNKFAHSQTAMGFEKDEIVLMVSRMNCKDRKADTPYRQSFAVLFSIGRRLVRTIEKQQAQQ